MAGLQEKQKHKIRERNAEATRGVLESGEQVIVSVVVAKFPPFWVGFIGLVPYYFFSTTYFVSLTDRKLIFFEASLSGRVKKLAFAYPRSAVSAVILKKKWMGGTLGISRPDGDEMRLQFGKVWQAEVEAIQDALSTSAPLAS